MDEINKVETSPFVGIEAGASNLTSKARGAKAAVVEEVTTKQGKEVVVENVPGDLRLLKRSKPTRLDQNIRR